MRSARYAVIVLATMSALAQGAFAVASEPIGTVRSCAGTAAVARGEQVLPASPGTRLFAGDILTTGADGTMGVILRDDSSLSLGPGSRIVIETFLFSPGDGKLGLLARITRGTRFAVKVGGHGPE